MLRKIVWAIVVLLALAICGGAVWFFITFHSINDFLALSKLPSKVVTPSNIAVSPDKIVCTGYLPVTAINAEAITTTGANEPIHTFNLTKKTLVWSLASAGQSGKTIADVKIGSVVRICPTKADRLAAGWIIFQRDPSMLPSADENAHSVNGKVTVLTDASVTITPADTASSSVTISLFPLPKIVTTVINGQTGRTLQLGDNVGVSGVVTAAGKSTATMILLAPILPQ